MSLVGTRPPTVDEWDKYELHHRARLATKPGLDCFDTLVHRTCSNERVLIDWARK